MVQVQIIELTRQMSNIVKHLRWSALQKNNAWVQVLNQKFFRAGGWRFVELGHFNKYFVKNTRKKDQTQQRNILEFFFLDILKTTF